MEAVILQKIKDKGVEEGFPKILSQMKSETQRKAEIMVLPSGNNLVISLKLDFPIYGAPVVNVRAKATIYELARDVIGYFEILHNLGYVHGYIQPENILME